MGFFNDIKTLFKVDPADQYDPAGRYLAFVIKSVADKKEDFLPTLLGIKKKSKWTCDTEYCFHEGNRRADLAIYEDGCVEPTYLVEVKVRDNKDNDHTHGQFKDYQKWAGKGNVPKVFFISPFGLAIDQMGAIGKSGKALKLIDLSIVEFDCRSQLVALFVEYLRDAGYIMKKLDDSRASAFTHFLICTFFDPNSHGLGPEVKNSTERISDGPLVFSDIVKNFQLLAQTFPSKPRKLTVRYEFEQALKATRVQESGDGSTEYIFKVKDCDEVAKKYFPSRQLKTGGRLYIYAYCPLGVDASYLSIGIRIEIDNDKDSKKSSSSPVTYAIYAWVLKGKEGLAYAEASLDVKGLAFPSILSSQQEAIKEFKKLAKKLVANLKKSKPEMVSNVQERLPSEWFG